MSQHVLLVEDSKEVHQMVKSAIGSIAELDWADTISSAKTKVGEKKYEMILLDIELPDGSGLEFCTYLQENNPQVPIFFLTSHTELSQKVLGFSAGADDYITKPFDILELKARVESRLKKMEILKTSSDVVKFKEIEINKSKQEVKVFDGEKFKKIDLTALEFKLLTFFSDRPEVVIPRDEILDEIWGKDVHVYSRSVDTHVSKLRKKLEEASSILESVHGAGYKFNPTKL